MAGAEYLQVLTTTASRTEAERIAAVLVQRRLAACVQIVGPIASRYRWRGEVEQAEEWRCEAKTTAALFPQVEAAIRDLHSYSEPEIVALPILAGSPGYLAWIAGNVG